jgi:hypothetical protein
LSILALLNWLLYCTKGNCLTLWERLSSGYDLHLLSCHLQNCCCGEFLCNFMYWTVALRDGKVKKWKFEILWKFVIWKGMYTHKTWEHSNIGEWTRLGNFEIFWIGKLEKLRCWGYAVDCELVASSNLKLIHQSFQLVFLV